MKKIVALLVALMLVCSAAAMAATDIAILVPNADHGWTGAVLTYAEEKAAAINAEGKYNLYPPSIRKYPSSQNGRAEGGLYRSYPPLR